MKYLDNSRARHATYMIRMKGVKKNDAKLSVLCGVDMLVASFSPNINIVQCWSEQDTVEFRRIRERYIQSRRSEKRGEGSYVNNQNISSPSFLLIQEEMVAIDIKLAEVKLPPTKSSHCRPWFPTNARKSSQCRCRVRFLPFLRWINLLHLANLFLFLLNLLHLGNLFLFVLISLWSFLIRLFGASWTT